jgi:hypothetical protein
MKAQKQGREPGGFSFKALAHQKPLALPLLSMKASAAASSAAAFSVFQPLRGTPQLARLPTAEAMSTLPSGPKNAQSARHEAQRKLGKKFTSARAPPHRRRSQRSHPALPVRNILGERGVM